MKISEERSNKIIFNIFPQEIANELKQNGYCKPKLYDTATIMFTDFVGFTYIAENMDPEYFISSLDGYFDQFDNICKRWGVEKIKTIGDAYMAAGGIPTPNNSNSVDVCLAALNIKTFLKTLSLMKRVSGEKCWEIRIGIDTGSAMGGIIGKTRFQYDVWGDAVNSASRMESQGAINKVNLSENTYEKIKDFFDCEARGEIHLKNKGKSKIYYLNGIKKELSIDSEGKNPNRLFVDRYVECFGKETNNENIKKLFDLYQNGES